MALDTRADLLAHAIAAALKGSRKLRDRREIFLLGDGEAVEIGERAAKLIADLPNDPWQLKQKLPARTGTASHPPYSQMRSDGNKPR